MAVLHITIHCYELFYSLRRKNYEKTHTKTHTHIFVIDHMMLKQKKDITFKSIIIDKLCLKKNVFKKEEASSSTKCCRGKKKNAP